MRLIDKINKNNYIIKIILCLEFNKDSLIREFEFLRIMNYERFVRFYGVYFYLD